MRLHSEFRLICRMVKIGRKKVCKLRGIVCKFLVKLLFKLKFILKFVYKLSYYYLQLSPSDKQYYLGMEPIYDTQISFTDLSICSHALL